MSTTHHRIPAARIALATTQAHYLAAVAERAVTLGEPTSDDSILYAFAITPVPTVLDAYAAPTTQEIAAVRAIVLAAVEVTR